MLFDQLEIDLLKGLLNWLHTQIIHNRNDPLSKILKPPEIHLSFPILNQIRLKELDGILNLVHQLNDLRTLFGIKDLFVVFFHYEVVPLIDLDFNTLKRCVMFESTLYFILDRPQLILLFKNLIAGLLKVLGSILDVHFLVINLGDQFVVFLYHLHLLIQLILLDVLEDLLIIKVNGFDLYLGIRVKSVVVHFFVRTHDLLFHHLSNFVEKFRFIIR